MDKVFVNDYKNFDFDNLKADVVVSSYLPANIISKLRKKGIVFIKASSLEEVEGLDVKSVDEKRIKRGVGCSGKF
jgi:hypothetical protein